MKTPVLIFRSPVHQTRFKRKLESLVQEFGPLNGHLLLNVSSASVVDTAIFQNSVFSGQPSILRVSVMNHLSAYQLGRRS